MSRPTKRLKLNFAPPEEEDLEVTRQRNQQKLQGRFAAIYAKYSRDFSGVGDEIDNATGRIVVDNGHIMKMRHERDIGMHQPRATVSQQADGDGDDELAASGYESDRGDGGENAIGGGCGDEEEVEEEAEEGFDSSLWRDSDVLDTPKPSATAALAQQVVQASLPTVRESDFSNPTFITDFSLGIMKSVTQVMEAFQARQKQVLQPGRLAAPTSPSRSRSRRSLLSTSHVPKSPSRKRKPQRRHTSFELTADSEFEVPIASHRTRRAVPPGGVSLKGKVPRVRWDDETDRRLMELRENRGMSFGQVANHLGGGQWSRGAVTIRFYRLKAGTYGNSSIWAQTETENDDTFNEDTENDYAEDGYVGNYETENDAAEAYAAEDYAAKNYAADIYAAENADADNEDTEHDDALRRGKRKRRKIVKELPEVVDSRSKGYRSEAHRRAPRQETDWTPAPAPREQSPELFAVWNNHDARRSVGSESEKENANPTKIRLKLSHPKEATTDPTRRRRHRRHTSDDNMIKKRWTREEDEVFKELLQVHGTDFPTITRKMPDRSVAALSWRFYYVFRKSDYDDEDVPRQRKRPDVSNKPDDSEQYVDAAEPGFVHEDEVSDREGEDEVEEAVSEPKQVTPKQVTSERTTSKRATTKRTTPKQVSGRYDRSFTVEDSEEESEPEVEGMPEQTCTLNTKGRSSNMTNDNVGTDEDFAAAMDHEEDLGLAPAMDLDEDPTLADVDRMEGVIEEEMQQEMVPGDKSTSADPAERHVKFAASLDSFAPAPKLATPDHLQEDDAEDDKLDRDDEDLTGTALPLENPYIPTIPEASMRPVGQLSPVRRRTSTSSPQTNAPPRRPGQLSPVRCQRSPPVAQSEPTDRRIGQPPPVRRKKDRLNDTPSSVVARGSKSSSQESHLLTPASSSPRRDDRMKSPGLVGNQPKTYQSSADKAASSTRQPEAYVSPPTSVQDQPRTCQSSTKEVTPSLLQPEARMSSPAPASVKPKTYQSSAKKTSISSLQRAARLTSPASVSSRPRSRQSSVVRARPMVEVDLGSEDELG